MKKCWIIFLSLLVAFAVPLLLECIIVKGIFGWKPIPTSFDTTVWFSFMISYFGVLSSLILGSIALWQNKRYKEMSDTYQEKMDELTILAEIFPFDVSCVSGATPPSQNIDYCFNSFKAFDSIGDSHKYSFTFSVVKNAIVDFNIISAKIIYHYSDLNTKMLDTVDSEYYSNGHKYKEFYPENSVFAFVFEVAALENNSSEKPRKTTISLTLGYKNIYNMPIEKMIYFEIDQLSGRQYTNTKAEGQLRVEKAKIIRENIHG